MKTSNSLLVVLLALAACGGDDDQPSTADAGTDAGSPLGTWKLAQVSDLSGTVTDVDTDVGGTLERVNGTLVLDATGVGEYVSIRIHGGRPDEGAIVGRAGMVTLATDTANIGGDGFTFMYLSASPESVVLGTLDGSSYEYRRLVAASVDAIDVSGRATIEAGTPALVAPRVALISMMRNSQGQIELIEADDVEPKVDAALAAGFGDTDTDTADFTLGRTQGALGFEATHYGTPAIAVSLLMAYEDRDHDNQLSRFDLDDCADVGKDCIRGIAPLVLGYRDGTSPNLEAAGFGLMREGWTVSAIVEDQRTAFTIVPLDPTTAPVPMDVRFGKDPSLVELPGLDFGTP